MSGASGNDCSLLFFSDNLVLDSDISLTTGVENVQFPISNLQNVSTVRKTRVDGNTAVIVFDLQQNRQIDALLMAGDSTGQFGITTASFKTSVTTDFSLSTSNVIDLSPENNIGMSLIDSVSHRYVELTLSGSGSFIEIGSVFVGEKIELTQNHLSINSFRYQYSDGSNTTDNDYGQRFINERPLTKSISGELEFCTKDEQEIIDDMLLKHGRHEPLWMIPDLNSDSMTDGKFKLTIYGYVLRAPRWSAVGGQLWNTSIRLDQVV